MCHNKSRLPMILSCHHRAESAAIRAGEDLEHVLGTLPEPRRLAARYVLYQQFECLCRLLELDAVSP